MIWLFDQFDCLFTKKSKEIKTNIFHHLYFFFWNHFQLKKRKDDNSKMINQNERDYSATCVFVFIESRKE